jgi:hypothetical protein
MDKNLFSKRGITLSFRYGAKLAEPKGVEVGVLYNEIVRREEDLKEHWIGIQNTSCLPKLTI